MTSEFDLKHIYRMKDLKKLKEAGASAKEIRRAHARLLQNKKRSQKATKKFLNLNWSCISFSLHQIKKLAEQGANLNVKNKKGYTLLHEVCSHIPCSTKEVKFLVKCGADVNVKDKKGNTPLLLVSGYNSVKILRFLVAHGADVNARNKKGETPLYQACRFDEIESVMFLLEQGADLCVKTESGETLLHAATESGNTKLVKFLVEQGLGVNEKSVNGDTPLHKASGRYPEMTDYLINAGAWVNAENLNGQTPLHKAGIWGCLKSAKCLVAHGAQMNAKNRCGRTPLHESVKCHPDLAGYLALRGADPYVKDMRGRTAFDAAPDYNSVVILKNAYEARQEELRSRKAHHGQSLLSVLSGWLKAHQRSE